MEEGEAFRQKFEERMRYFDQLYMAQETERMVEQWERDMA